MGLAMKLFNDGYLMCNVSVILIALGLLLIHPGLALIALGTAAGAVSYCQYKKWVKSGEG